MKQFAKHFLSVLLLLSATGLIADCSSSTCNSSSSSSCSSCDLCQCVSSSCSCSESSVPCSSSSSTCESCGSSLILPRPQGLNSAALFNPYYYSSNLYDNAVNFELGFRFNRTFHGRRLAKCLFGSSTLVFEGSDFAAGSRTTGSLMADYFGLPTNYEGQVAFNPRINDYIFDFVSQVEFGNWHECLEGLYVRFNAALVHTSWDLRPCATIGTTTCSTTASNYQYSAGYMACGEVQNNDSLRQALSGTSTFGQMQEQWNYGRFDFNPQSITRVANIDAILGYDFLRCDSYHFGAFIKAVAPTGNRPLAQYVFEPIAGNGHHWELGGGVDAHYNFWECDDQEISAYLYGQITHLFKDKQYRSFDMTDAVDGTSGCMSRYMLLKVMCEDTDGNLDYKGHLMPAINWSTRKIQSSFDVMGDASIRLMYRNCGWVAAVGYNVYGRSKEKIGSPCCYCDPAEGRTVAAKGNAAVCTGEETLVNTTHSDNATITSFGTADTTPIAMSCSSDWLCFKSIPSQLINKVFASLDHQWRDCDCQPFLGIGGEGNFAKSGDTCTPNTWGIWIRGGFSY